MSQKKSQITVVLNLYKRPETLKQQLEAIEAQTLQPDEIILFQDKANDVDIEIPQEIRPRFSLIEVSAYNQGVWGRFKFALNAKSTYVCVFDDDTIPGKKWLENCMSQMQLKEGIYGTNGILMLNPLKYPKNIISIGWKTANRDLIEVDFVGHAWFFKKEWLNCLFNAPQSIQRLKICGEDMSFSYQCSKELNIKTYVPPHPIDDIEMFGSIPQYAYCYGNSDVALSTQKNNIKKYNQAINLLLANQPWEIFFKRHKVKYLICLFSLRIISFIPNKNFRKRLRCFLYGLIL